MKNDQTSYIGGFQFHFDAMQFSFNTHKKEGFLQMKYRKNL